jgi:hypothetical protein
MPSENVLEEAGLLTIEKWNTMPHQDQFATNVILTS